MNSEAILKLCPTIQKLQDVELHGLERVEDSVRLCLILMQIGVLRRVIPSKLMYPNPNAKEAEKPKQVDMAPQQGVSQTGLYIFVMEQSAAKMNFYLVLVVFGLVFFMLYRVWPVWLKLWVYYFSYYTLCFLVSLSGGHKVLDWRWYCASYRLVPPVPRGSRLLDLPQLLHRLKQPARHALAPPGRQAQR